MEETNYHLRLYRRVAPHTRDGGEFGLQHVSEQERLFTHPTLLCCGGLYMNHAEERAAHAAPLEKEISGLLKYGHALIGYHTRLDHHDPIDIVAVSYPLHRGRLDNEIRIGNSRALKDTTNRDRYTPFCAQHFVETHLQPLLQNQDGERYPLDRIKRNFRNVQVLAHSYGCHFMTDVGNVLVERMEKMGFTADEIADITSQALVVHVGSAALPGACRASFTSLYVQSHTDNQIKNAYPERDTLDGMLKNLFESQRLQGPRDPKQRGETYRGNSWYPKQPLTILPFTLDTAIRPQLRFDEHSRNLLVYAGATKIEHHFRAVDPMHTPAIDPDLLRSDALGHFHFGHHPRPGKPDELEPHIHSMQKPDNTNHQLPSMLALGLGRHGMMLRSMVSAALTNGMSNAAQNAKGGDFTPLPDPYALLSPPEHVAYPTCPSVAFTGRGLGYAERIAVASGRSDEIWKGLQ